MSWDCTIKVTPYVSSMMCILAIFLNKRKVAFGLPYPNLVPPALYLPPLLLKRV